MNDDSVLKAVCDAVVLGTDENEQPIHLTQYEAAKAIKAYLEASWRPISEADKSIAHQEHFPSVKMTLRHSERYWVRDNDGRVYEASWSEGNNGRNFWWDWEGESPVNPVEFMPHPASTLNAKTQGLRGAAI
ncbi:MAG: hypothetical protein AAGD15_01615 [Agrobacterium cavarae]|uniref:hypothetical protein n=1 Tax=Agrobacterium cavarae TaxID=2528239 RepID=UPI0031A99BE3